VLIQKSYRQRESKYEKILNCKDVIFDKLLTVSKFVKHLPSKTENNFDFSSLEEYPLLPEERETGELQPH
jgi:hypothetical protein